MRITLEANSDYFLKLFNWNVARKYVAVLLKFECQIIVRIYKNRCRVNPDNSIVYVD